jgi:hypothetical protein
MSRNFDKRLAQVEQRLADVAKRREQLTSCNCKRFFGASEPDIFEEEANLPCPAHGFRDLGQIFHTVIVPERATEREKNAKVAQLIAAYETARARHRANLELE